MSEKEHDMLEKIRSLPKPLQEKFVDRLDGAVMAIDTLAQRGEGAVTEGGADHDSNHDESG